MSFEDKRSAGSPMRTQAEGYFRDCPDVHLGTVVTEGRKEMIAMNSTAYIPLFRHPAVIEAVREALPVYGVGAGSRYNMGHVKVVRELEERLAEIAGVEEAVLFPSGYNLNLGVDSPAFGPNPYFIADQRNHPSILSGIRLSAARHLGGNWGANCSRYITNDMENLEAFLSRNRHRENVWILTVGTYGPFGERVNLPGVAALAREYGARVFLDDVHFFWVYGPRLCGLTDHYGIRVDILMGSFKAFGLAGAFALGAKEIVSQLRFSEPYIFSIGLLPVLAVAAHAALDVLYSPEGREMVDMLWRNAALLREEMTARGFRVLSDQTQMICIRIPSEETAVAVVRTAKEEGLLVQPYFHPPVPRGVGHIRLTPLAAHTPKQIRRTADIMAHAAERAGMDISTRV